MNNEGDGQSGAIVTKKSITAPVQPWQWNTLEAVGYKERIMGHRKQMLEMVCNSYLLPKGG